MTRGVWLPSLENVENGPVKYFPGGTLALLGGASGDALEPIFGACHGLLRRGDVGEGVGLREEFLRLLALLNGAGHCDAGHAQVTAQLRDLPDAFAHQGLAVNGPFCRDDEVAMMHSFVQASLFSEEIEATDQVRIGKGEQTKTEASGGACAGCVAEIEIKLLFQNGGQLFEVAFSDGNVFGLQSFLRPIDAAATFGSEQRVLDIDSDD